MRVELRPGMTAPDFTLPDQHAQPIRLSDYRGNAPVVLYFYPKDDTSGCTAEACKFRDEFSKFRQAGAVILGVSKDSAASHRQFASKYQLPFTLLTDESGLVTKMYGVKKTLGIIPGRATFVIDRGGIVKRIFSSQIEAKRHAEEALKGLEE